MNNHGFISFAMSQAYCSVFRLFLKFIPSSSQGVFLKVIRNGHCKCYEDGMVVCIRKAGD